MGVLNVLKKIERRLQAEAASAPPPVFGDTSPLVCWVEQIRSAKSREEVLSLVDKFRPGNWADAERAKLSQVYIRKLEHLEHRSHEHWKLDKCSEALQKRIREGRSYE